MSRLELLAIYERISVYIYEHWEYVKQELRVWLGPEPLTYFLLDDGRVLPSTITIPEDYRTTTYQYTPHNKQITLLTEPNPEGRFRPLPYLGIVIGTIDISDWLGELRANPVPPNITANQIVQLWSYSSNTFLPKTGEIKIVKSDGTEETTPM